MKSHEQVHGLYLNADELDILQIEGPEHVKRPPPPRRHKRLGEALFLWRRVFIPPANACRCIAQPKISALIFLRPTLHSILINDTGLNETA